VRSFACAVAVLGLMSMCAPALPARVDVQPAPKPSPNLVPNYSFESVGPEGVPQGWRWDPRNTNAWMVVDTANPHSGKRCVKITNGTPFGAHVYGSLWLEQPIPLQPGKTYTLSYYLRSEDPGALWVGGGHEWRIRLNAQPTGGKWQRFATSFTALPEEQQFHLRINTDSPTPGVWIDDLKLEEGAAATYCDPPEPDPSPWILFETPGEALYVGDSWSVKATVHIPQRFQSARLRVAVNSQQVPEGSRVLQPGMYHVSVSGYVEENQRRLEVEIAVDGGEGATAQARYEADLRSSALAWRELDSIRSETARLRAQIDELKTPSLDTAYPEVTLTILENFTDYIAEDLRRGEYKRAWDQIDDLKALAERLRKEAERPNKHWFPVPRWTAGPLKIRGSSFLGVARNPITGAVERRPIIFTGYGHFGQVREDLEKLPRYGVNIIQIEIGPSSVFPEEGKTDLSEVDGLVKDYKRASAAGVAICQLISPHYMPNWVLEKYPHLRVKREGFLQYCLHAPEGREILSRFISILVPLLKNHSALHSICLSNEPVNAEDPSCKYAQQLWRDWLSKRHGTIEKLNSLWGTRYKNFDDVPLPEPAVQPDPLHYEFVLFNQEFFASWHRFLADCVHRAAPNVPVHAKAMTWNFFSDSDQRFGVDAELFGQFSQINGNDAANFYSHGRGEWAQGWLQMAMGHDLQRSVLDAPVFNTENHLIPDRETRRVPPEHLRTALWQAAVHGQSATAIWVWERTYDPRSDFAGSVMHRPACAEAVGRTGLDLMRLSKEVAAIQSAPADVVLLYSTASMVYDGGQYTDCLTKAYTALSFTGLKIGFVTERQLARGYKPKAKLIVVPNAKHLPEAAWRGLLGCKSRVLLLGRDALRWDDYGRERQIPEAWLRGDYSYAQTSAKDLLNPILLALEQTGIRPAASVTSADGGIPWGVEWRCAKIGRRLLVNMVNYNHQPVDIRVTAPGRTSSRDLLTGLKHGETLRLAPLQPVLLQFD
jgi:hypothetical protein